MKKRFLWFFPSVLLGIILFLDWLTVYCHWGNFFYDLVFYCVCGLGGLVLTPLWYVSIAETRSAWLKALGFVLLHACVIGIDSLLMLCGIIEVDFFRASILPIFLVIPGGIVLIGMGRKVLVRRKTMDEEGM